MKKEDIKIIIENWADRHFSGRFVYYILSFIFISLFLTIFYLQINAHSFLYLFLISFIPSIFVVFLSFLLLRERFILFAVSVVIFAPILTLLLIVYVIVSPVSSYGYAMYTNNFTKECVVKVIDYTKGYPWYTTKGCYLDTQSKDMIRRYAQLGGGAMRWNNVCKELRFKKIEFVNEYNNVLKNNRNFDLENTKKINYSSSTDEYILITKINNFKNSLSDNLLDFKNDVPNLVGVDEIVDICSMNNLYLGTFKVF